MDYKLIKDVIGLLEEFESQEYLQHDIEGFKQWIADQYQQQQFALEINWEGKDKGRSAESVINTLIVHMNRYAKFYSKAAIHDSPFATQEEFIFLINLKAFGAMSKMDLIKKNIHDKPSGMQVINRLIANGWVSQEDSEIDKRSKVIQITASGITALALQMEKIRHATKIVTGKLNHQEKNQLIYLLAKLDDFHNPIYKQNFNSKELLTRVMKDYY